jgi:serine/threonine-protein kinase
MSELRTALGTALGPACMVEREVRPIGGCRLFVALELPAGTELLVKVLPGDLTLMVDPARLERELLLLADRLGDPGFVAPRGGGRAGSFVYHTRRFVEGTTLRAWLARHGEMPLHRAVDILRSVLAALVHAHGQSVTHGDLKPENVLLTDGQTLVVDAGVVDAVGRSLVGGTAGMAREALCAPAYLAPEGRSGASAGSVPGDDIYAVGVLAHEMLTGQPPAPESEALDDVRALPTWMGELIRRCLAEPAGRSIDAATALTSLSRASWGT